MCLLQPFLLSELCIVTFYVPSLTKQNYNTSDKRETALDNTTVVACARATTVVLSNTVSRERAHTHTHTHTTV